MTDTRLANLIAPIGSSGRPDLPLAVVVGAGGLGLAVARRLGARNRLLLADRDADHLERVAQLLNREGHDIAVAVCDVTDPGAVAALAARAADLGPLRTLAHVVGVSPSMADGRAVMSVDLIGAALVDEAMLDVAQPGTASIFICSLSAHGETPTAAIVDLLDNPLAAGFLEALEAELGGEIEPNLAYSLAKWGLRRRVERRAAAWAQRGARIVSISPGLIATPQGALEFAHNPRKRAVMAQVPMRRECTMLEIADALEFLASERASYITGIDLLVDGGVAAARKHAPS